MVKLTEHGGFLDDAYNVVSAGDDVRRIEEGRKKTMSYRILEKHNHSGNMKQLKLKFDCMVSPDNNYVNILQTAKASGLKKFPVPYVLSNCHNTLCSVGGTILEDDHAFGLSNAKKYGGIFLPPYRGVLHQYMREMMAGGEKMILGSDSHTRYGALGTMGIGEGGGELVKQLVGQTYDIAYPKVVGIKLMGKPKPGVGPMDVALALISKTFANGFSKNNVLEFVGPGIANLSMEFRMGIDVMTTESAALSSVWETDEKTEQYLAEHGRDREYKCLRTEEGAYYDKFIEIDMDNVEPMIALPFHPSHAMPIREFKTDMANILKEIEAEGNRIKGDHGEPFIIMNHMKEGEFYPDQALVSGCAGGLFENIVAVADILKSGSDGDIYGIRGNKLNLHVNPASLPVMEDLMTKGIGSELAVSGVTMRPCICGPCFGVTDAPADNQISIRHVTRNYPNREGSKPGQGQMAAVCLMDARSIAATVRNGGKLTGADELTDVEYRELKHTFNKKIYEKQVFDNYGHENPSEELVKGPNIADWPEMAPLKDHILLKVAGSYKGSVTTDELIPSGEASSYRSNPEKISGFTMISRDPDYVGRAKALRMIEAALNLDSKAGNITLGSIMISDQIGDGSSREQAASCQKVLGGFANLANEYSTKRYRSNLINWGILPLRTEEPLDIPVGTYLFISDIKEILSCGRNEVEILILNEKFDIYTEKDVINLDLSEIKSYVIKTIKATLDVLTEEERNILLAGCLINHYKGN
ncbi:aconitate hydratase [Oribacterium sp. KHPX15]|uniref:hydratase n=1 Tax=Oribacterium sp. KHPX15 TaxID=1855342 RepID=UPI0008952FF5|nr:hydratase [Oribacterium sp. KHPX15]SEA55383.1 aconitate hydratase [Oribacterium sp. KHPX15]